MATDREVLEGIANVIRPWWNDPESRSDLAGMLESIGLKLEVHGIELFEEEEDEDDYDDH